MRDAALWTVAGAFAALGLFSYVEHVSMKKGIAKGRLGLAEEAVHHGAARWEVNEDGERRFVWNESESGATDAD